MGNQVVIDEQVFTDIADAIRDRNGETATYKPREMAAAVEDLHNVRVTRWVRPSDWPDYFKVDLTDQEVIYLTYDCTYDDRFASFRVSGAYTVERGQIINGVFVPVANSIENVAANTNFAELLPTNEGDYVVYKITPQEGSHITSFRFRNYNDINSSYDYGSIDNPCVERYCNIPYHTAVFSSSNGTGTDCWVTCNMEADTVMGAAPNGACVYSYTALQLQALKYINLSGCSFANVTSLQCFCYNCPQLLELYLPHDLSNKCTSFAQAFYCCERLVSLDLTGWDTSNVTAFNQMFYNCFVLTEVKGIEDFDLTSAINLSGMFTTDRVLEFDTSKWKTSSALTNCSSMFSSCCSLKNIDLSGFVTTNVTTFSGMFNGCESIRTIDLTSFDVTNKVTNLASMFIYCRNLETIIRNKNWDTSGVTTFEAMFQQCSSLKDIDLSDFDFSNATTVKNMFNACTRMKNINLTADLTKITNKANVQGFLQNCVKLSSISQVNIINSTYMPILRNTRNLLSVVVPSSVTMIADYAFSDMNHLRILDFRNHEAIPTLNSANDITTGMNAAIMIIVPDNLYNNWINTTNWSNVMGKIISATDYDNFVNPNVTLAEVDLSQYTWAKKGTYNANAAVGAAYSSVIYNTGNRIATLVDIPANKTVYVSTNDGYMYAWFGFDSSGYTKSARTDMKTWHTVPLYRTSAGMTQIGLVVWKYDGTVLDPADWADSGITVSYAP